MSSPTSRSLALLRERGYTAAVTEHWNSFARIRQDLFGFVDVLAVGNGHTLAVQTTSYSNVSARVRKINESAALPALLAAGWQIVVHGWRIVGGRWMVREVEIGSAGEAERETGSTIAESRPTAQGDGVACDSVPASIEFMSTLNTNLDHGPRV